MTRAEFVKFLANIQDGLDLTKVSDSNFKDVSKDKWYADYIDWAFSKGIVAGYASGDFGPNDVITREQMAVMIDNFAKASGITLNTTNQYKEFADNSNISSWANDSVKKMQIAEIINGKNNNIFDAKGIATRAEASKITRILLGLSNI